jgi:hypothetical protein
MKVNFSTVLNDLQGQPLKRVKVAATKDSAEVLEDLTAASAACDALMAGDPNEKDGKKKIQLFNLALRLANGNDQEIEAAEVVLLEERIAASYAPIVVGRMHELLNG